MLISMKLLKKPSAWIPIAMSLSVLALMLVVITHFGVPSRQEDEGTGAHLFQIWLLLEVFMITFFGVKWLPQKPSDALLILFMQIVAVLLACSPVRYFNHPAEFPVRFAAGMNAG